MAVAILGLAVARIPFVTAGGIGISLIVLVMVLASITLLPALLRPLWHEAIDQVLASHVMHIDGISHPDALTIAMAIDDRVKAQSLECYVDVEHKSELTRGYSLVDQGRVLGHEPNAEVVLRPLRAFGRVTGRLRRRGVVEVALRLQPAHGVPDGSAREREVPLVSERPGADGRGCLDEPLHDEADDVFLEHLRQAREERDAHRIARQEHADLVTTRRGGSCGDL